MTVETRLRSELADARARCVELNRQRGEAAASNERLLAENERIVIQNVEFRDKIAKLENEANHYCTEWRLAKVHAAEWHGVVETICTLIGLSSALGAHEAAGEVRDAFARLQRERDGFKEEARQRMTIAVEQKRRADRLEEATNECRNLLGAARQFVVSGPSLHGVKIEREGGFVTREELANLIGTFLGEHKAAGRRAVLAIAGLTFGTNPDRLELEDLPSSDPLCIRCADSEPGSTQLATECTCGRG